MSNFWFLGFLFIPVDYGVGGCYSWSLSLHILKLEHIAYNIFIQSYTPVTMFIGGIHKQVVFEYSVRQTI